MLRFILLSTHRSGTNLLREMINSHPRLRCYHEFFNPEPQFEELAEALGGKHDALAACVLLRDTDPVGFVENYAFDSRLGTLQAVGFKLMYDQPAGPQRNELWTWLAANTDIKIIHMVRRNELLRYASTMRAEATGEWVRLRPSALPPRPVHIDADAFHRSSIALERSREEALRHLAGHELLPIAYEDLVADTPGEMTRVFDFLVVDRMEVRPLTFKQGTDDLRAAIHNHDELRRRLAGTNAAGFLADLGNAPSNTSARATSNPTSFAAAAGSAPPRRHSVHLVGHIGIQDRDILPHWLGHYRALGVDDIHLVLHGPWDPIESAAAALGGGVTIADTYDGPFEEAVKCTRVTHVARRFIGDWVLIADADEFLELPFPTLAATLRALCAFGMTSLPAIMLQRVTADGTLAPVGAATDLAATFPLGVTLLVERMAPGRNPIWRAKHPLFLVQADSVVRRGHHLAPDDGGVSGFGLQAVVHHFKWRASLLASLAERSRNERANGPEMTVVAEWLAGHENILSVEDGFACDRDVLLRRGLLRRPTRTDIALGLLLHRLRLQADGRLDDRSAARLSRRLDQVGYAWRRPGGEPRHTRLPAEARGLAMRRASIALVTFEMPPPDRTGGIATWVLSAAASLKRLGHRVTIIYAPYRSAPLEIPHREVWASRGVDIIPLVPEREGENWDGIGLVRLLAEHRFDIVHLPDAVGLGALAAAAKRQGFAFHATRFIVTTHGPTDWHNRGNDLPRSETQIRIAHAERRQAEYADEIVAPSAAMARWMESAGYRLAAPIPVHPNLLSHGCWSGRRASATETPVRRIVFFGRLEPRKGLALFCDAIDMLIELLNRAVEIIFLGRAGSPAIAEYMNARAATWPWRTVHFSQWASEDALLFLGEPGTLAVVPSTTDNYPYTILECLGGCIPFIATSVGGIPDMIHSDDHERVLVRPEATAIAQAIKRAVSDGHAPARPASDFATVELQWLAWHGAILADAPEEEPSSDARPAVSAIVMAAAGAGEPACLTSLRQQVGASVEVLVSSRISDEELSLSALKASPVTVRVVNGTEASLPARAANLLAPHARNDFLVFCGAAVDADPQAVAALARGAERLGADAMVAGHRLIYPVVQSIGVPMTSVEVHPPAGPLAIAAVDDVFGGHLFLIRRQAFNELGGFRESEDLTGVEHRDLLNRLLLRGGRIASVPYPLYDEPVAAMSPRASPLSVKRACLQPFVELWPRWQRDLLSWVVDSGWPWRPGHLEADPSLAAATEDRLARIRATTLLRRWATDAELASLTASGDAELVAETHRLTLVSSGTDPILMLPPTETAAAAPIHVLVDLQAPEPTEAQLFWSTPELPYYNENQSVRASVRASRQVIALSTPSIRLAGQLRVDPGTSVGRYAIYGVEIWTGAIET